MKLYRMSSRVRSFVPTFTWEETIVHWIVVYRSRPVGPYPELISGHAGLDDEERSGAEEFLDQFFTEDEAETLKDYLESKEGLETILQEEVPLPFPGRPTNAGRWGPMRELYECGACGPFTVYGPYVYKLCDQPDYGLPFEVWGIAVRSQGASW